MASGGFAGSWYGAFPDIFEFQTAPFPLMGSRGGPNQGHPRSELASSDRRPNTGWAISYYHQIVVCRHKPTEVSIDGEKS